MPRPASRRTRPAFRSGGCRRGQKPPTDAALGKTLPDLAPIAGAHHGRLDGKGYPRGLAGDQIGLETRVITTADIFDALTADRSYRAAMTVTKALGIMSGMVGTQIDADCFTALQRALGRIHGARAA